MKKNLPRWIGSSVPKCLATWIALASASLHGQSINNASFEADTFTNFPGYTSGNGGVITDWTLSNNTRIGLNPGGGTPFAENGTIPSGTNVAFLQAGSTGAVTMSQTVTGLTIGTKYHVEFRVNARNSWNGPFLEFSTDAGEPAVSAQVTLVGGSNPYKYVGFDFTATNTSHVINIANTINSGDHTLLIDDVTIATSTGAWSFGPWQDDATSGVDSAYLYTHAVNFASNAVANINGVPFIPREFNIEGRFSATGLDNGFGNRTPNNVTGNSAGLAKDFRYNGNTGITLDNLKPNTQYVFTAYGIGFDVSDPRAATFSSNLSSEKFTANLNQYGQGNGMRVNYTYTTDALGSPVTINYPSTGAGTFHTSGFSNREAAVNATPSPWSTVAWSDDATSGIDGSYLYTHAYNFGNATGANVNGVNFTGIAGANPSAANYTSVLGALYNNDVNNITGFGAALAKDFVYAGFPEVHNLSGLTPGKNYVLTLYSVGWEAAGNRFGALVGGKGDGITAIDQDQFGDNNGIRIEYRYTADSTGNLKVTSSEIQSAVAPAAMHIYAMSNREADALVSTPPTITLQPTGVTLGIGSDCTLNVGAVGSSTITYQWKLNGNDVSGATNPTLVIEDIDYAEGGVYTCVITNGFGSLTSNSATVQVLDNVPGLYNTGVDVDKQPLAAGATDSHYTLLVNPDNTSSTLALVQSGNPVPWNPNSATSLWIGPRANTGGAAGQTVDAGEGLGTYVYRTSIDLTNFDLSTVTIRGKWASDNEGIAIRVNGTVVTGLNNLVNSFGGLKSFTLDSVIAPTLTTGINTIDFVIINMDPVAGFTGLRIQDFEAIGLIAPNTAPHIAVQPVSVVAKHNQNAKFAVAASGSATVTYQWYFDGEALLGETQSVLVVPAADPIVAGDYKVRVSNGTGFVDSSVVTLTIPNIAPVAVNDLAESNEDTPLEISVLTLLSNDTDADLDLISFTSVAATSVQGGTVSEVDGTITYTPPANFHGLDTISYTINDGIWGGTHTATVNITVNPVADVPPGALSLTLSGGVLSGSFTGTPGTSYSIERSTTLEANDWVVISTTVAPLSGIVSVRDNSPPQNRAFYRIVYPE